MVRQALGVAWLPTSGESTDGAAAREAMQSQTHGERKASAKSDLDRGRLNDCNAGSRLGSAPGAIEPARGLKASFSTSRCVLPRHTDSDPFPKVNARARGSLGYAHLKHR